MTYRKDNVEYHREGFGDSRPAVNVKVRGYVTDEILRKVANNEGYNATDADTFIEWWHSHEDNPDWEYRWTEFACESGWEDLQNNAEDIFGRSVKVYSEGRSGGWAVVHGSGLDDVDSWDAIALGQWRTFARFARGIADYIPESAANLALINGGDDYIRKVHEDARRMRFELAGIGL